MKKPALHPRLQSTAVPVPGHSGCYAVVPPTPEFFRIESLLLPLARREMQVLRIPVDRDRAFRFNVTEDSEFA